MENQETNELWNRFKSCDDDALSMLRSLYVHKLFSYVQKQVKQRISFEITNEKLSLFSEKMNKWVVEPGEFEVQIGSSSRDIRLKKIFIK